MKKIILIAALLAGASAANAQSWLDSFLKVATEQVGDIVAGTTSSTFDIKGTWKYQGVAVGTSSDNVLGTLAANAGTSAIESKCDNVLAKVGIKAGAATLTFAEDGSFTLVSGKISIPGTWTKEDTKLTINIAKLFTLKLVGTVKATSNGCEILFDSQKFLTFVQKVVEVVSKVSNSASVTALKSAVANVKDLQLGFKLSK